jgi:hypothetical protein
MCDDDDQSTDAQCFQLSEGCRATGTPPTLASRILAAYSTRSQGRDGKDKRIKVLTHSSWAPR